MHNRQRRPQHAAFQVQTVLILPRGQHGRAGLDLGGAERRTRRVKRRLRAQVVVRAEHQRVLVRHDDAERAGLGAVLLLGRLGLGQTQTHLEFFVGHLIVEGADKLLDHRVGRVAAADSRPIAGSETAGGPLFRLAFLFSGNDEIQLDYVGHHERPPLDEANAGRRLDPDFHRNGPAQFDAEAVHGSTDHLAGRIPMCVQSADGENLAVLPSICRMDFHTILALSQPPRGEAASRRRGGRSRTSRRSRARHARS